MHFTAYTPATTGNKSYCKAIPDLGMTNLVFDYEGKKLRQVSIEFEVTKEPEGTPVFYRPPDKTKSGSVDGVVDFKKFGEEERGGRGDERAPDRGRQDDLYAAQGGA